VFLNTLARYLHTHTHTHTHTGTYYRKRHRESTITSIIHTGNSLSESDEKRKATTAAEINQLRILRTYVCLMPVSCPDRQRNSIVYMYTTRSYSTDVVSKPLFCRRLSPETTRFFLDYLFNIINDFFNLFTR
jgi:hypothetical protein